MAMFEKDFIMRQVRQLARVVAGLVVKARGEGDFASGLEAIRRTTGEALGRDYALLSRMDPDSVTLLTREPEELQAIAWVTAEEADLHEAAGDAAEARRLRERAMALYGACAGRWPDSEATCREAARGMVERTGDAALSQEFAREFGGSGDAC